VKLFLITGAGASRNLGRDETQLPLMGDWADALCTALDTADHGLSAACHLAPGMSGPEFEKSLGQLMRWQEVRHLEERFEALGVNPRTSEAYPIQQARERTTTRLNTLARLLNVTLFEQFGQRRIDVDAAAQAYNSLLERLGADPWAAATTNYDRSLEAALRQIGHAVSTGFRDTADLTPWLDPGGMMAQANDTIPVLHLHGAVGWYSEGGVVYDHRGDRPFNPTLGLPVVLYPDPGKDPTATATVSALWREFEYALNEADAIFVLGHSLHDPPLVRALRVATSWAPVAISYWADGEADRIHSTVPDAVPIHVDFGPNPVVDERALSKFLARVGRPSRASFGSRRSAGAASA